MDYAEAKDATMTLDRVMVQAAVVARLANRLLASAGFVLFDAMPPRDICACTHYLLFADAIYTALAFVSPQCRDEWLVVSRHALVLVRGLPFFTHVERSYVCPGTALTYIGSLRSISVYVDQALPNNEWLAGAILPGIPDEKLCCRGVIQNSPCVFGRAGEERDDAHEQIDRERLLQPRRFLPVVD